jgi:hypothetical protein
MHHTPLTPAHSRSKNGVLSHADDPAILSVVMAGLDPAIHDDSRESLQM